jgi:large subunit ribosomal protein L25
MATETVSLKADVREKSGSNQAARLRKEGKLPVVVYGHKKEAISMAVNAHEFIKDLHHGHRLFSVELAGKNETLLLKTVQYDYLGKDVIHADLIRVNVDERMTVKVPLEFRGVAKGTAMNGILDEAMSNLEIECGVMNIPASIKVVVRDLGINDSLHAKDIVLPDGCTLVTDPNALVVICHESKVVVEAVAEGAVAEGPAAAAEPVVLTERKKDEAAE